MYTINVSDEEAVWWKSDVNRGISICKGPLAATQLIHLRKIRVVSMARIGDVRGIMVRGKITEESGGVLNHGFQITFLLCAECI